MTRHILCVSKITKRPGRGSKQSCENRDVNNFQKRREPLALKRTVVFTPNIFLSIFHALFFVLNVLDGLFFIVDKCERKKRGIGNHENINTQKVSISSAIIAHYKKLLR